MPKAKTAKKAAKPAKRTIQQAPAEHYFVLVDGRVLRNIKELADIMDDMADHVFQHHVNWERNDFAKWAEDVFKDMELADKLRKASGKQHTQIVIYRHLLDKL
jgi:hypothetical protein